MQVNNFSLIGRLGQDPEIKYFESGVCLASFSVAVTRSKDVSDWFDCVAWEKSAEIIGKYVTKGREVGLSGTIYHDVWTDKSNGEVRSKPMFRVDRVTLIGSKKDEGSSQPAAQVEYDLSDF
jgi:single-strand DNA-binding protein